MGKLKIIVGLFCMILIFPACVEQKSSAGAQDKNKQISGTVQFPGNEEGARQLLLQFLQPGIEKQALTKKLRPNAEDFMAVFIPEVAKQAEQGYRQPWDDGKILVHGQPGQTELLLWSATVEELQKQSGDAGAFPSGYAKAAPYFKNGLRIYRFKFVRPGEQLGFAWDGLIYVNGHWVIFPKPWRVIPGLVINVPAPEDQ
jgi:hypothetical protein